MTAKVAVALTGATGYVGSRVCLELLKKGYTVHAPVRSITRAAELKKLGEDKINLFEVSDIITGDLVPVFKGCKYVVHCASPVVFQAEDPERDIIKPAVEGTTNVLRAAVAAGVTRVVYTATMASICGSQREKDPDHVWTEEDWNDAPGTHYSRSKTLAEKAAWDFAKEHPQLEFVTIHPSYVIGPMTLKRAEGYSVEGMIKLLRGDFKDTGVPASLYGLVDVRDVANAHVLAMEHPSAPGNRFICGSKDQYSYFEWAQRLKALYPNYPIPSFEQKPTTPKKNSTNNNKIQQVLGLKFTPLDDTLHAIVENLVDFGYIPKL